MPFSRPTLDDLRLRIKTDIMGRLPGTDALLRWNNLSVIGEVEAGTAHLIYGRLDWSFRQLFPDTAEGEFLERWAGIWGITRRDATQATGTATWAANAGTSIYAGAIVSRGDNELFTVTESHNYQSATGTITVPLAAQNYGASGNSDPGVQLTLSTTITAVSPLGTVDDPGIAGGADAETDDELLARLLARIRQPPHGGTATDYVQWALEVPGVTRAWCFPLELGPGTVTVRFMMDDVRADQDGIPTPADVDLVQAHIDEVRPVTAAVFVMAPLPQPLNMTIAQLYPDTAEVTAAIQAEMEDLVRRETIPGGELYQSQIFAAINSAAGVVKFRLVSPIGDVQAAPGYITTLGTIAYV